MRTNRKFLTGILVTLTAVIAFVLSSRVLLRPPMPETWHNLHAGMPHEDILNIIPDEHADLRSLKGFESFTHKTTMLGSEAYWQLEVFYDSSGGINHADAAFYYRNWDFLSSAPRDILTQVYK